MFVGRTDDEAETPIFGHLMRRTGSFEKTVMLGKIEAEEKGAREDEMVRCHLLDGHKFERAPGVGDGQGSLAYCSPWGHKDGATALN